jgi:hypothetical protein
MRCPCTCHQTGVGQCAHRRCGDAVSFVSADRLLPKTQALALARTVGSVQGEVVKDKPDVGRRPFYLGDS